MSESKQVHGDLIRIDPTGKAAQETLRRIPLGTPVSAGGIDESSLRDLLFQFPGVLPVGSIDAAYTHPVPVCRELSTPAGYVDAVYANPLGRLVLAEFKLWRNPQARREVIGQILDYAKEFASWSYEDLQREVSRALGRRGNVPYELVRSQAPDLSEADFVDNVSRHLARGEFLLLIVGDGIREGVENIVNFVQRHSGLHFTLAMVEAALYRDADHRIIVQPRCLARTEVVQRFVFGDDQAMPDPEDADKLPSHDERENQRFWNAVLRDYTFSDVTVDVPEEAEGPNLNVPVPDSGFGKWGLWFTGRLDRKKGNIECYLSRRSGTDQAERVFADLKEDMDGLRTQLGGDLRYWEDKRIGFQRKTQMPFPSEGVENDEFDDAVAWMQDHLDRLVSTLYTRLHQMMRSN